MAFSIYKPGQGYWTRLLSALGAAAIVIGGAIWLAKEIESIGSDLPVTREPSRLVTDVNDPAVKAIESISLVPTDDGKGQVVRLTTPGGEVTKTYTPEQFVQILKKLDQSLPISAAELTRIDYSPSTGMNARFESFAARNVLYIQAITVVLVVGIFGGLILWLSNKASIVDFLIATDFEMKKVNWPTKKELAGSTLVVIIGMFMLTFIILVVDVGFIFIFSSLGVIPQVGSWKSLFGLGG